MVRCPECGSWIWFSTNYRKERVCSNCGAILKRKISLGGLLLEDLEVVGHTPGHTEGAYPSNIWELPSIVKGELETGLPEPGLPVTEEDLPERIDQIPTPPSREKSETVEKVPSIRADRVKWGHCNHCHALIVLSNASFCSNCGASLTHGLKDATPLGIGVKAKPRKHIGAKTRHGEKCTVCGLQLTRDDNVARCPHCGNPAHRTHLLEWIHRRNRCPVCGKYLDEKDF
jgi:predicted RNA-binding Zn-ribbon protein involved in translation (DUF1610 family)